MWRDIGGPHASLLAATCPRLPGHARIAFSFPHGIVLYAQVAAVFAGFSVALVGLLAQKLAAGSGDVPDTSIHALSSLIPGVALLVLAAYLYAEAGGSTSPATQLVLASLASVALAGGALSTFLSFVLLAQHHDVLALAARSTFWVAAMLTTGAVYLGNQTFYESLYRDGRPTPLGLQGIAVIAASVLIMLLSRRGLPGSEAWTKAAVVAVVGVALCIGGAAVAFMIGFHGDDCANLDAARNVEDVFTWSRVAAWILVLAAFSCWLRHARPAPAPPEPAPPGLAGPEPARPDRAGRRRAVRDRAGRSR